ncbi:MAG: hypothetical protein Q9P01_15960 [Anaerolineae bacterium]|nr:hypothetical protein [Anaerolineae bacterium]MDQ7036264.1 hypothetical protein [Anaerolineae bacterium]
MPSPDDIAKEQEKLYESASLRDDLNDAEGAVLLDWGQTQVTQMAQRFPDEFEKKTRFLRQLIKNINRFVGQREFNDRDGQGKYMLKVVKYLEALGYTADEKTLFAALPTDPKDMMANLKAILTTLTPQTEPLVPETPSQPPSFDNIDDRVDTEAQSATDKPISTYSSNTDKTEVIPDISHLAAALEINRNDSTLENPNSHSINQADGEDESGENIIHDEKEE